MIAPRVKLNGLGDGAVFLFDGLIVGRHIHGVFAFFGVGLPQLQAHRRNRLRLGTAQQRELVIVPVALVFQHFQIARGMGN